MNSWVCTGTALAFLAGAVLLFRYGPRTAPGRGLPALTRPPVGGPHVHRDGLPWCDYEVEPPPWRHHCWPHSGGWLTAVDPPVWFERCPCGGHRENGGRWVGRNGYRRREDAAAYIEPTGTFYGDVNP